MNKLKFFFKNLARKAYSIIPWRFWGGLHIVLTGRVSSVTRFRRSSVGNNCYIDPSVQIIGWKNVRIGDNTTLSENTWLNVNHRNDNCIKIIIGNNCHIGKSNFFSSGPCIHIKDYGFTGIDCHFLGCGHNTDSPMVPYIASGLTEGAKIEIGVNCWLTTAVTVLQGVKIGYGSVIGAHSIVVNDVPPFSIAVGNPCKVIKRYNFNLNKWIDALDWLDEFDEFMPTEDEYLDMLIKNYSSLPLSLLGSSRRFGWL